MTSAKNNLPSVLKIRHSEWRTNISITHFYKFTIHRKLLTAQANKGVLSLTLQYKETPFKISIYLVNCFNNDFYIHLRNKLNDFDKIKKEPEE